MTSFRCCSSFGHGARRNLDRSDGRSEDTKPALRCAGSLGWGFPAALGAKCALSDTPVICFTGDGGFGRLLSELETAQHCGIDTVTLIDNHSLNQDKARVDRAYGGVATGNREEIWVFRNVDISHITPSMGCFVVRGERPGESQNAFEQASASGKPAVVDIASDINAFAPLPHVPD